MPAELSDADVERIADAVLSRIVERLTAPKPPKPPKRASANITPALHISPHVAAAVAARLARKGEY